MIDVLKPIHIAINRQGIEYFFTIKDLAMQPLNFDIRPLIRTSNSGDHLFMRTLS